jgi:hypothetical protein
LLPNNASLPSRLGAAPHRTAATQADDPPRGDLRARLLRVISFGYGRDLGLNQPTYAHLEGWSGDGGGSPPDQLVQSKWYGRTKTKLDLRASVELAEKSLVTVRSAPPRDG